MKGGASHNIDPYTYDDLGNRISHKYRTAAAIGYEHDKANRMTKLAGLTQNYDLIIRDSHLFLAALG